MIANAVILLGYYFDNVILHNRCLNNIKMILLMIARTVEPVITTEVCSVSVYMTAASPPKAKEQEKRIQIKM